MRDEPLRWTARPGSRDGVTVLELDGPLTLVNIFEFQRVLVEITPALTVVDLARVPYMDSAGLGVLINFYVSAEKNGRRTALAGANDRVEALLDMTRVRELLRSVNTVDDAEAL